MEPVLPLQQGKQARSRDPRLEYAPGFGRNRQLGVIIE